MIAFMLNIAIVTSIFSFLTTFIIFLIIMPRMRDKMIWHQYGMWGFAMGYLFLGYELWYKGFGMWIPPSVGIIQGILFVVGAWVIMSGYFIYYTFFKDKPLDKEEL